MFRLDAGPGKVGPPLPGETRASKRSWERALQLMRKLAEASGAASRAQ
jgi:hypothetical protein